MKKIVILSVCLAIGIASIAFVSKPVPGASLVIAFDHYAGSAPLRLDTVAYRNDLGQPFMVTMLKYYIGLIRLDEEGGSSVSFKDYYLVDEEDEASGSIALSNIPAGRYTGISFLVGVDSAGNCSGAQAGALDPVHGMFWAWNTGYIFFKLEGKSASSALPGHIFEYHIGGYKAPAVSVRRISLRFPQPLVVAGGGDHHLAIKADVAEVLKVPTTIDFARLPSVTDTRNAAMIADNYADMFSVTAVR